MIFYEKRVTSNYLYLGKEYYVHKTIKMCTKHEQLLYIHYNYHSDKNQVYYKIINITDNIFLNIYRCITI